MYQENIIPRGIGIWSTEIYITNNKGESWDLAQYQFELQEKY